MIKQNSVDQNSIEYFHDGWKQKIGNIYKIFLKGDDFERGLQYGCLLADEIKNSINSSIIYFLQSTSYLPGFLKRLSFLIKPLLKVILAKEVNRLARHYPEWLIREMDGMAKGAGIDAFYIKLVNFYSIKMVEALNLSSCCAFAFTDKNNAILNCKNLDWIPTREGIDNLKFLIREDEKGKKFAILSIIGFLTGFEYAMNDEGLAITLTGRYYRGKRKKNIYNTTNLEFRILREAKNLADVEEIYLQNSAYNRSHALLISSKKDHDYKLFEISPITFGIVNSGNGILFNTNTYISPALRLCNKQWGAMIDNIITDPRYLKLKEYMKNPPDSLEDAFKILADDQQEGLEAYQFLGKGNSLNRFITNASAVIVSGEQEGMWLSKSYTYAGYFPYYFITFSSEPQNHIKERPAHDIINRETFKNFQEYMNIREHRHFWAYNKIISRGMALLKKEPENPVFILFTAQNHIKFKNYNKARQVLKQYPAEYLADYWYCLGKVCYELKNYEEGKMHFSRAMTLPSVDGFELMGQLLCLVQVMKCNKASGLIDEVNNNKAAVKTIQQRFTTKHIGMPDYPYMNNITDSLQELVL